jgi:hypothetical protein
MMRTAQVLKCFSYVIVVLGVAAGLRLYPVLSWKFLAVVVAGFLIGVVLRLLAIIGQLVYEMRHDTARTLNSMERTMFQANALLQEVRDLLDARSGEKV